jgi:hypothetical protein
MIGNLPMVAVIIISIICFSLRLGTILILADLIVQLTH